MTRQILTPAQNRLIGAQFRGRNGNSRPQRVKNQDNSTREKKEKRRQSQRQNDKQKKENVSQLVTVRVEGGAGNVDGGRAGGGLEVLGQEDVGRRPVDKVDEEDAEGRRVRVDSVPRQLVALALGDGGVGRGAGELDGGNQRGREGEGNGEVTHFWWSYFSDPDSIKRVTGIGEGARGKT